MLDYIRIACAVPEVQVANVEKNTQDICKFMKQADAQNADILLFPELALTGYTCGDLFFQDALLQAAEKGLQEIIACAADHPNLTVVLGLPIRAGSRLLNCAAVISEGQLKSLVSKTFLPDYDEFDESRWFSPAPEGITVQIAGATVFADNCALMRVGDALVGVEICEDLFAPIPPSSKLALAGAEVILNLSASPEFAGKRSMRTDLVKAQSSACKCIYAYTSAGYTESTADVV